MAYGNVPFAHHHTPRIRSGIDPTTVAVMMEDGGAVAGLAIAAACTALAHATGNAMWDAAGSIMVRVIVGLFESYCWA